MRVKLIGLCHWDGGFDTLAAEGRVILCGIAYDPKTKIHSCVIDKV